MNHEKDEKKIEKAGEVQPVTEAVELSEENLDDAAGGGPGDGIGGVEVGLRKKPGGRPAGL